MTGLGTHCFCLLWLQRDCLISAAFSDTIAPIYSACTHAHNNKNNNNNNTLNTQHASNSKQQKVYLFTASVFLYASEMNAVKRKRLWRHEHVLDLRVQALQAEHDAHVERHEQLVVKTEGGLETEAAMRDLLKDKGEHGLFALYVKAMSGSETASKVLKAFLISHRAQSNAQATQTGKKGDTVHMMEMSVAATAIEVGTAWMERLRAASKGGGFRKQSSDATEAPGKNNRRFMYRRCALCLALCAALCKGCG